MCFPFVYFPSSIDSILRVDDTMCIGQRHVNIAQHLAKYTTEPKFLTRLSMEQTMVEGENYDAYVSGPLVAPLSLTKKLIERQ